MNTMNCYSWRSAVCPLLPARTHSTARLTRGARAHANAPTISTSSKKDPQAKVITIAASVMFSCSMLRVNFSAAAPMIAADLNLSVIQLAYIHSAFLAGYLVGHIPAGLLADGKFAGARVLCIGATAWAVATVLHASIALFPHNWTPFVLAFLRFLVGATTAVAIPGLAATIAQALPEHRRTHVMSTCYGWFNIGSVVGLASMPLLSSVLAWPDAFAVFGGLGVVLGATCLMQVLKSPTVSEAASSGLQTDAKSAVAAQRGNVAKEKPDSGKFQWGNLPEYAALIWAHSVIGWGFFLFQNWLPTFLQHMNVSHPISRGLLSALPWIAPAVLSFVFRSYFEFLRNKGMPAYKSQTIAHTVACLGAAAALVPLAIPDSVTPTIGLACIGVTLALQTCNYSGFHAYVQHYFADSAGSLLGVTNSCGIVVGMVANMAMGWTLTSTGSYAPMFAATAVLYASSWLIWMVCLHRKRSAVA